MLEFWNVEEAGSVSFDVLSRSNVNLWLVLTVFGTFLAFFARASNVMQSNQSLPSKGHHLVADVFVWRRSDPIVSKKLAKIKALQHGISNCQKYKVKLIIGSKDREGLASSLKGFWSSLQTNFRLRVWKWSFKCKSLQTNHALDSWWAQKTTVKKRKCNKSKT